MKQKYQSFILVILLVISNLTFYVSSQNINQFMNDLLDGTFIDFDYQVAFISSSPYTPSDYNCQLLGFYDLTNCYLSSDKTKFYMNLYSNSTLSKNQYRDINPLPFFYLNKPFDKISVNVYIMLPQNMIPPNVILSYPSPYVNICEDTTIQIISEFVTGNNPLIIKKWNLESINPSNSANAITLTQLLSSSPNQKNLTLPKLSLNENTEYQFSIDIENFIGTQNKIFFNLKTLTQNTPFIKVIEPKQFKNIDFRNSFNFKISYNTSLCGSGSTPVQANKISIALQDGSNILYNQAQMTGLTSQDYDFSIPSQFLQSERLYDIIIQLEILSTSTIYKQSFSIKTMSPILTSGSKDLISDFIQDNGYPIQINMNYNYIDNLKWECIDLLQLSNECTSMFGSSLNQNIIGMLPNRMYQITFSISFGSQISFSSFLIILADLSNTNKNKIYQFENKVQSQKYSTYVQVFKLIDYLSIIQYGQLLLQQNYYQPFNLVIYMLNFEVLKVEIPSTNDVSFNFLEIIDINKLQQNKNYLFSMVLFNRKPIHNLFNSSFNQRQDNCQLTLSSNFVEAFTDNVNINLIGCDSNYYSIYVYSDYQLLQKDLSLSQFENGVKINSQNQQFSLIFSNNANQQNYNQFFILAASFDYLKKNIIATINVVENPRIINYSSFLQIILSQLQTYQFDLYKRDYIVGLVFLQFEYMEQKSCDQKCSLNGSCQLLQVQPFNQTQTNQCLCENNYFFYDCTASKQQIETLINNIFRFSFLIYFKQSVQLLRVAAQIQFKIYLDVYRVNFDQNQYFYSQFINYNTQDFLIYKNNIGCKDRVDHINQFFDELIAYQTLFENIDIYSFLHVGINTGCRLKNGEPAYYFEKNNFCGIIKQVPFNNYYISKMFNSNQIIVNQICQTGELEIPSNKDLIIPYYPNQQLLTGSILKLMFLKKIKIDYYQDQIKPGFIYSGSLNDISNSYNLTFYFNITTFYEQNKQLTQNFNSKFQNLICISYNTINNPQMDFEYFGDFGKTEWKICEENEIILQKNSPSLLKCVCSNNQRGALQAFVLIQDTDYQFIFANEVYSVHQVAIGGYIGLVLLIQIICSLFGIVLDRKKKVQIGVAPVRRQSTLVDLNPDQDTHLYTNQTNKFNRRSSILLEINNQEIQNSKKAGFCISFINAHSIGKIHFNYSLNVPRFQRYLTQFFIYLSIPAVGGLYAKYEFENLIQQNLALFCICMSPLGLRIGMAIFDLIYYSINRFIKIKIFNYLLILIINLSNLGFYCILGYIYYRLWTDSNVRYLYNWLVYSILILIFHAFIFEAFYMTFSIFYVRSEFQKNLQKLRRIQLKKKGIQNQKENQDEKNPKYNRLQSYEPGNLITLEANENQLANINRQSQLVLLTKTTLLDKMQINQIQGDLNIQGKNKVIQFQPTKSQVILKQKTQQKL